MSSRFPTDRPSRIVPVRLYMHQLVIDRHRENDMASDDRWLSVFDIGTMTPQTCLQYSIRQRHIPSANPRDEFR